jgi:uncharacterized protein (DUF433 family)
MLRLTKMVTKKSMIISDPAIMMGKPVIAGTRITVELILEKLAAGETVQQILDAHPRLTEDAIKEALSFAARALKSDVVYPVSKANA